MTQLTETMEASIPASMQVPLDSIQPANSISLVKYDKPEWVVQKPKYNRYKLINWKKFFPGAPKNPRGGKCVFAYDKGDSLLLTIFSYGACKDASGVVKFDAIKVDHSSCFSLKVKEGRVIIWRIMNKSVRNFSGKVEHLKKEVIEFGTKKTYFPPHSGMDEPFFGRVSSEKPRDFKIFRERLNKILINFLKRNNIIFNYSKDPFQNLRVACYPNTAGLELQAQELNPLYSCHFIHGDIKYAIKQCFGYDSPKLVKLICEKIQKDKKLDILSLGCLLKGLVPVDYFHQMMDIPLDGVTQLSRGRSHNLRHLADARALLKNYSQQRILKLVKDQDYFNTFYFWDSFYVYSQRKLQDGFTLIKNPKNWLEIHNCVSPPAPRHPLMGTFNAPIETKYELPIKKPFQEINGIEVENFKFEIPNHTDILEVYSNKMNNCIRWYGSQVLNGSCDLLGIYKNGELAYNISIRNKTIDQFFGKSNSQPPLEDKIKIFDFLKQKKLVIGQRPESTVLA